METRTTQQFNDPLGRDLDLLVGTGVAAVGLGLDDLRSELPGELAKDRAENAFELADARLPRVVGNDLVQSLVGNADPGFLQSVALDLPCDEVALGDLELLVLGVTGELNDL